MQPLVLTVAIAVCVLWAQARWVVSAALRALGARCIQLSRLEAAALEGWLNRLRRAVFRAQRMGVTTGPDLAARLEQVVPLLGGFCPDLNALAPRTGATRRPLPTVGAGSLPEAYACLILSERELLEAFSSCAWFVDRGRGQLVETARFHRRIARLQEGRLLLRAEKRQLTQNKWLRSLGLV